MQYRRARKAMGIIEIYDEINDIWLVMNDIKCPKRRRGKGRRQRGNKILSNWLLMIISQWNITYACLTNNCLSTNITTLGGTFLVINTGIVSTVGENWGGLLFISYFNISFLYDYYAKRFHYLSITFIILILFITHSMPFIYLFVLSVCLAFCRFCLLYTYRSLRFVIIFF